VGYAKAKHKPVIYMRQKDAPHSTTVAGISDYHIFYADMEDIQQQLQSVIVSILKK
jgi:2'-deoxynucleoside 5'-phosphate N-hydrolase